MDEQPRPPILTRSTRPSLVVIAPVLFGIGAHQLIRRALASQLRPVGIAINAVFLLGGVALGVLAVISRRCADALLEERDEPYGSCWRWCWAPWS